MASFKGCFHLGIFLNLLQELISRTVYEAQI